MNHKLRIAVILAAAAALAAASAGSASASQGALAPAPAARQQLAALDHDTAVRAGPSAASARVSELSDTRPITGAQTVVPVLASARGPRGMHWLKVLLPGRPDSHTGWISQRATTPSFTNWRITVSLSARTLTVFYAGHVSRIFSVIVGKPSTPTPTGSFFVEESVQLTAVQSGAPYALALSARSNVLAQFDGGPGQIALHGVENIGGIPGTAVSHGCVRLSTPDITWLAAHISAGVRVTIEP